MTFIKLQPKEDRKIAMLQGAELCSLRRLIALNGQQPDIFDIPKHLGTYERLGYVEQLLSYKYKNIDNV